tara:strand:+ start:703 stop:1161 length:459 start_codon:yes stop_codon:yes gene_type:complete
MKIKNLFIIVLLFVQSCGYTPIYTDYKNLNYKINIVEIKGEPLVNNLISSRLNKISNEFAEKKINLKISSENEKKILSKNKKNEITYYLIVQNIDFEITWEGNKKENFTFSEEIKIENIDDQFEFKKYQDAITKNFINSKIDEFILKLSKIK